MQVFLDGKRSEQNLHEELQIMQFEIKYLKKRNCIYHSCNIMHSTF
jgi:hypothetical protein